MLPLVLAALLAAGPAAAPPAPPAALDTVYLKDGGRARGTVIEDSPETGVTLQLSDGSVRRYSRAEVARVQFAGEAAPPAAAPPPPAYPPPPMAAPPAEQPAAEAQPARDPMAPAGVTFALGLSGAWTGGSVSEAYGSTSDYWSGFTQLDLEGGVRLNPATTLLLQIDLGGGSVAGKAKDLCDATGLDCTAATFKIGIGARYAFAPFARNTPWISAVIAREGTGLTLKGPGGDESIAFGGWEWLRLGAGWDWRFNRTFGLGAFTSFSLATYNGISTNNNGMYVVAGDLGGGKTHTWFVLGVRAILFP